MLDRNRDGNRYLLSPDPDRLDIDEAHVLPNLSAKSWTLEGDAIGSDRVKAYLFTNREQAKAILEAFRGKADGVPLGVGAPTVSLAAQGKPAIPGAKRIRLSSKEKTDTAKPFFTSELSLEFVAP